MAKNLNHIGRPFNEPQILVLTILISIPSDFNRHFIRPSKEKLILFYSKSFQVNLIPHDKIPEAFFDLEKPKMSHGEQNALSKRKNFSFRREKKQEIK